MPDLRPYEDRERVEEAGGALAALGDGDYRVRLIKHGKTRNGKRYYRQEALEAAAKAGLYENAKMFINHRDPSSDARRGHRDVRDWAATIKPNTVTFTGAALEAVAHVHDPVLRGLLDDDTAKAEIGLSQDATIRYHQREIDGASTHVVEAIEAVHSVDFVPTGNAWGRVLEAYAEAVEDTGLNAQDTEHVAEEHESMPTISDVTLDVLEVERPDLVEALTERVREADAKTSRAYESWGGLSSDDVQSLIQAKLRPARDDGEIGGPWVRELYESEVIVSQDGEHTRYPFSVVDADVVLGTGVRVKQAWVPIENATEAAPESGPAETSTEQEAPMSEEQVVETEEQETAEPEAEVPADESQAAEEQEAADRLAALEAENAALREKIARAEMTEAVREAVAAETGLTSASKRRVVEAVSTGAILTGDELTARIAEACETERAHEAEIAKALGAGTRVRNLGASVAKPEPQSEDAREAARDDFRARAKRDGLSDAQIERLLAAR